MVNQVPREASMLREDWPALSPARRAALFPELPRHEAEEFFRELDAAEQADLLPHLPRRFLHRLRRHAALLLHH